MGNKSNTHLMKVVIITFGLLFASVVAQNDCLNPLLTRSDVIARFGGSANILNVSRNASSLPICPNLNNKAVCVSDEGFFQLKSWALKLKLDFETAGQLRTLNRYKGIITSKNITSDTCFKKQIAYNLYLAAVASFAASGAARPWNFSAYKANFTVRWADFKGTKLGRVTQTAVVNTTANSSNTANATTNTTTTTTTTTSSNSTAASNTTASSNSTNTTSTTNQTAPQAVKEENNYLKSAINYAKDHLKRFIQAKANCAKDVFKHIIAASCLAASANYNTSVTGNANSFKLKLSKKTCLAFQKNCLPYFDAANAIELAYSQLTYCNNAVATKILEGFEETNVTKANQLLNDVYNGWLNDYNIQSQFAANKTVRAPSCTNTQSNASDCNFICQRVINATGANLNLVQTLDVTSNNPSRLLQDSSIDTTDDGFDSLNEAIGIDATVAGDDAAPSIAEVVAADSSTTVNTTVTGGSTNVTSNTSLATSTGTNGDTNNKNNAVVIIPTLIAALFAAFF
eukprot:TRINITY_DN862_c0_g1_i1.p1 TRINITY_DN862_c0_g1~~TRINITY_DN862_c0_g1_i1.p1  ORF type:complete len:514 (+),score=115.13 TRINITY_DN862_c0_g1_i1:112-1653(+)